MTEPTDADLWQFYMTLPGATPTSQPDPIEIMRAALAKWGTPPAVAGEPYGYVHTVQVAPVVGDERKVGRTVFTRSKPPCDALALYTTPQPTQAQAGAVPLTNARLQDISLDYSDSEDECTGFRDGWRAAEKHYGIKGGQHG